MMLTKAVRHFNKGARASKVLRPAFVLCQNTTSNNLSIYSQQKRNLFGKTLYNLARGVMPPISKTEQVALGCGTIGMKLYALIENIYRHVFMLLLLFNI